jgi:8-oxo-dGTP diphosphatase
MLTVGCGVFVRKEDKILLGRRGPASRRGAGCWALPGGRKEPGESLEGLVKREVFEETGLLVNLLLADPFQVAGLLAVTDHNLDPEPIDHLSTWILADWAAGEPKRREPDKCYGWSWWRLDAVAEIEAAGDRSTEQFYWIPLPLWRRILAPYFPRF